MIRAYIALSQFGRDFELLMTESVEGIEYQLVVQDGMLVGDRILTEGERVSSPTLTFSGLRGQEMLQALAQALTMLGFMYGKQERVGPLPQETAMHEHIADLRANNVTLAQIVHKLLSEQPPTLTIPPDSRVVIEKQ